MHQLDISLGFRMAANQVQIQESSTCLTTERQAKNGHQLGLACRDIGSNGRLGCMRRGLAMWGPGLLRCCMCAGAECCVSLTGTEPSTMRGAWTYTPSGATSMPRPPLEAACFPSLEVCTPSPSSCHSTPLRLFDASLSFPPSPFCTSRPNSTLGQQLVFLLHRPG